jgi:PKD repeat protein
LSQLGDKEVGMRRSLKFGILVLLGLGLAGCVWLFPPLQAVLTATPTSGTAPLDVTFNLSGSTGPITSWTLEFGDGSDPATGTGDTIGTAVVHTYTNLGPSTVTYTATLTVQDNRGGTSSDSVTITVFPGTICSLSASPVPVQAGSPVTFTIQATAAYGRSLASWELDIDNDGTPEITGTASGPSLYRIETYTYATAGTYTAKLTVTDNAVPAQTATASVGITVTSPPPEITSFTVNGSDVEPISVPVATDVTFSFHAQAGAPARNLVKWELSSGDGYVVTTVIPPANTLNVTHVYMGGYTQTGSYTARGKVGDDLNHTDEESLGITGTTP